MRGRTHSSSRWLQRQRNDVFVKQAQAKGYRSRAIFKLEEMDQKFGLFKGAKCVVDLGAAPGSWAQYVAMQTQASVIACDLLEMDALAGVHIIQGDFTEEVVYQSIVEALDHAKADVILSDMAPNLSGNRSVDIPKAMYLCELAVDLAQQHLRLNGHCVLKVFHGEGFDQLVKTLRELFQTVKSFKPKASRKESRETYLVALNFKG